MDRSAADASALTVTVKRRGGCTRCMMDALYAPVAAPTEAPASTTPPAVSTPTGTERGEATEEKTEAAAEVEEEQGRKGLRRARRRVGMDDDTARRPMVAAAASASAWSQPHMSSMMAAFRQHGRAQGVHEERNTRCTLGRTSLHEHFSWLHTTSALVHQHAQTEVLEQEHRRRGSMVVRTLLILVAPSTSAALSSLPEKHILNSRPSSMLALRREGRSRPARCRLDMEETQWAYRQHGESEQRTSTEKKKK